MVDIEIVGVDPLALADVFRGLTDHLTVFDDVFAFLDVLQSDFVAVGNIGQGREISAAGQTNGFALSDRLDGDCDIVFWIDDDDVGFHDCSAFLIVVVGVVQSRMD